MESQKHPLIPATRSILSTNHIITDILPSFAIGNIKNCIFLNFGLNDSYLITTDKDDKYILRVYRSCWRSIAEISYEVDVLNHLKNKMVQISFPIPQKNGQFVQTIQAVEGTRYIVLFSYAPGKNISYEKDFEMNSFNYGSTVAKIHNATDDFSSKHNRYELDFTHLLENPLKSLMQILSYRNEDWLYLQKLVEKILNKSVSLPINDLEKGFCHGDFHRGNGHINSNGTITFFDFDCCGWGWRAYDLAVFRWGSRLIKKEKELWEPFIRGYSEKRFLNDIDIKTIFYFIGIRHIWLLGLHASNGNNFGYGFMDDDYFDRAFKFLKEWEKECFT